jgi:hypothetical protein
MLPTSSSSSSSIACNDNHNEEDKKDANEDATSKASLSLRSSNEVGLALGAEAGQLDIVRNVVAVGLDKFERIALLLAGSLHQFSLFPQVEHLVVEVAVAVILAESFMAADEVAHLVVAQAYGRTVAVGTIFTFLHPDLLSSRDLVGYLSHYHLRNLLGILRCLGLSHDHRLRIGLNILRLISHDLSTYSHLWLLEGILTTCIRYFKL